MMRKSLGRSTIARGLCGLALASLAGCGSSKATSDGSAAGAGGDNKTIGGGGAGGTTSGTGGAIAGTSGQVAAGESVLTHHKNPSRDGVYVQPALTKTAAAGLHKLTTFTSAPLTGMVYAQPLFVDGGASGPDLVIVATEANNVYALNGTTGAQVWMRNLGAPVPLASMPCGNIDPYGVTGTPVIDLGSRTLFVDGMTTPDAGTTKKHLLFALSIDDGSIKSGGWPVDIGATVRSGTTTFNNPPQSQRGALAFLNGSVYVAYGGLYGDCGTYHGWLVAVSGADPTNVQAWATSANAGGIWGPGGVASDGSHLFVTTGNTQGASATNWGGGEGLLRFTPGASFATPTSWAPTNWVTLDNGDVDLGGTGPVIFNLAGATPSTLALALGKDGNAYLLDPANLAGVGGSILAMFHASTGEIITAPAVYTTAQATYVAFRAAGAACTNARGDLTTLKVMPGAPPTLVGSWCATAGAGAPMVTTSDGHADAIVWTLGAEGDGLLHGYDGDTGAVVFGGAATTIAGLHHFNSPIAAKGRIYVAGDGGVVVFAP